MQSSPEDIRKSVKAHVGLAIVIAILTSMTVAIAVAIDLQPPLNFVIALIIAAVQASIVGHHLMHIKTETPMIKRILLLTGVFLLAMLILTGLAFRNHIPKIL